MKPLRRKIIIMRYAPLIQTFVFSAQFQCKPECYYVDITRKIKVKENLKNADIHSTIL